MKQFYTTFPKLRKLAALVIIINLPSFVSAQAVVIFKETINTGAEGTTVASYNGWSNGLVYTHSSFGGNVFLTTVTPTSAGQYAGATGGTPVRTQFGGTWTISGINTAAYTGLTLSFGIRKTGMAHYGQNMFVCVSADGITYDTLTFAILPSGAGTGNTWHYRTATGTIPSTSNLRIRFANDTEHLHGSPGGDTYDFDDIEIRGVSGLLPVRFTGFQAMPKNGSTVITWGVGAEENVKQYQVQRSVNGQDFYTVANVLPSNNGNYTVTDSKPIQHDAYYRIKSVNNDESSVYSKVVKVTDKNAVNPDIKIRYAGADRVSITSGNTSGSYSYQLVNMNGQIAQQGYLKITAGSTNDVVLNNKTNNGSYVLIVSNALSKHTQRVLVK